MDCERIFNLLVESTGEYLRKNNLQAMVLGYSLPCSTNQKCEVTTAQLVGQELCDEFHEVNLEGLFLEAEKVFNSVGLTSTPISRGNIKARLRGNFLYNAAGIRRGLVIDTDNMTEHLLGFWTIAGGDECDFNPIGQLWKHEVYELAHWLANTEVYSQSDGLKKSIELIPTDGNGITSSDLEQIAPGCTYGTVDNVLQTYLRGEDVSRLPCADMIINRHRKSEFKRRQRPLIIDLETGSICEKNGALFIILK